MKRMFASIIMMMSMGTTMTAAGAVLTIEATMEEGTAFVPVREIFEAMGAAVFWEADTRTVCVEKEGRKLYISMENTTSYMEEGIYFLNVETKLIAGKAFVSVNVPFSFARELGMDLEKIVEDGAETVYTIQTAIPEQKEPILPTTQRTPVKKQEKVVIFRDRQHKFEVAFPKGEVIEQKQSGVNDSITFSAENGMITMTMVSFPKDAVNLEDILEEQYKADGIVLREEDLVTSFDFSMEYMTVKKAEQIRRENPSRRGYVICAETEDNYYLCTIWGERTVVEKHRDMLLQAISKTWKEVGRIKNRVPLPTEYVVYGEPATIIHSGKELSERSDFIVKGIVLAGSENVLTEHGGYTETNLELTKVYKGDLQVGDVISLREPYYTTMYQDGSSMTSHRDNYYASDENKAYLFFLKEQKEDGLYTLSYSTLSRYSLDARETETFDHSDTEPFRQEVYDAIKAEVLEMYP